jgi:mono/diheme cytochrome c family protein
MPILPARPTWMLAIGASLLCAHPALGGDSPATQPASPGAIAGRVVYAGEPPPVAELHASHDPEICGKTPMRDESLLVSDGGLANTVVVLQLKAPDASAPLASAAAATPSLDQRGCMFVPHVQSVTLGSKLAIQSSDPVLHNVHAFLGKRTAFNLAIPVAGQVVQRKLDEPGILRIRCDSGHTWMSAYIAVVPHRFHATSAADGSFRIADVPPGDYTLRAWHERLGAVEQKVRVGAGAAISLTFRPPDKGPEPPADPPPAAAPPVAPSEDRALAEALQVTRTELQQLDDRRRAGERARLRHEGQPLFGKYCATCHGERGDGKGPSARFTHVPPRDFTRGTYKFRMSPAGAPPSFEDLVRTISVGVRGTHMPGWRGRLTRAQIETLARYLTTLSDVFWTDAAPPPPLVIPPETPYDSASIARGKLLFKTMQCATCHGVEGDGRGPAAATLRDDWGEPIRPADFTAGQLKGGCCGPEIFRAISTGLAGAPMPSFAGATDTQQRWDLAHYVLSLGRHRPAVDYLFRDPAGRMTPP